MRTILKIVAMGVMASTLFTGCGNKQIETPTEKLSGSYTNPELQGAPKWVIMPYIEGAVSAVGSAPTNAGNDFSFQREEAMADGRDNLAKQLSVKVQNMFKAFKQSSGSGSDATFDKATSKVSKQIASQTLAGSRMQDFWMSPSNTMYVLMILDTTVVKEVMEKQVKTSFKNDKAMYQQFLAAKAQGELDIALEKANMQ